MATTEIVEIIIREKGAKATSNSIRSVGRTSRTAASGVRLLTTALAALGIAVGARELLEVADASTRLNNQIRLTSKSTEEFNAIQSRLRTLSNDTRAPIESTVRIFRRLRIATRDLGTSTEDVLKVTEGLNAVIAVSGATAQEGASGLIQLAQGLASGRLQGDELRSVLENLPPLAQALGDELGITTAELRKWGEEGKLNAETIFPALLNISDEFIRKLQELPFTLDQARTILRNTFLNTVGDIDAVLQATTSLSGGILTLSNNLRGILIEGVIAGVEGFILLNEALASTNEFLSDMGIETLPKLGQQLRIFGGTVQIVFGILELAFTSAVVGATNLAASLAPVLEALGLIDKGTSQVLRQNLAGALEVQAEGAERVAQAGKDIAAAFLEIAKNEDTTTASADRFRDRAAAAQELLINLEKLKAGEVSDFDLSGRGEDRTGGDTVTSGQKNALKSLIALTNQLRIAEIKRIEPLDAQLEKLRQQEQKAIDLANKADAFEESSEALLLIQSQILGIETQKTTLLEEQEILFARISKLVEQAALFSPKLAEEIRNAAIAAEEAGGGLEKIVGELEKVEEEGAKGLASVREEAGEFGQFIADELARGIGSAVSGALRGEGFDAAKFFADLVGKLITKALTDAVEGLGEQIAAEFRGAESAEGGAGGFNFGGLIAAGFTAGIAVLSGALQDTTTDISNNLVKSAASQSEAAATRGVIAGPTSIPIFQVGVQLEAALGITNEILLDILGAIQAQPAVAATGGGGDAAAVALTTTTGSLI